MLKGRFVPIREHKGKPQLVGQVSVTILAIESEQGSSTVQVIVEQSLSILPFVGNIVCLFLVCAEGVCGVRGGGTTQVISWEPVLENIKFPQAMNRVAHAQIVLSVMISFVAISVLW
jgi:hypothetical protein